MKFNLKEVFQPKLFGLFGKGRYDGKTFTSDLIAGIIVGIIALPLAIAFGIASGVTPQQGLITAIVAGFLISFFGGSNFLIGGPTGAFIVIVAGIVGQYGMQGLIIATIMAGVFLVIMGVCKMGAIFKFIPYPIVVGFTPLRVHGHCGSHLLRQADGCECGRYPQYHHKDPGAP